MKGVISSRTDHSHRLEGWVMQQPFKKGAQLLVNNALTEKKDLVILGYMAGKMACITS